MTSYTSEVDLSTLSTSSIPTLLYSHLRTFAFIGSFNYSEMDLTELRLPNTIIYDLDCSNNKLTKLPELPDTLIELYCQNNLLTELPHLKNVCILECDWHKIVYTPSFKLYKYFLYVSRLRTEEVFIYITRMAAIFIQRNIRRYLRRKRLRQSLSVIKIQKACHNWLYKIICGDGTYGIQVRLGIDMKHFVDR